MLCVLCALQGRAVLKAGLLTGLLKWMTPSFQQGKPYRESESQFELANPGGILVASVSGERSAGSGEWRMGECELANGGERVKR